MASRFPRIPFRRRGHSHQLHLPYPYSLRLLYLSTCAIRQKAARRRVDLFLGHSPAWLALQATGEPHQYRDARRGISHTNAASVGSLSWPYGCHRRNSSVVFGLLADYAIWGIVPGWLSWVGGAIVTAAMVWGSMQKAGAQKAEAGRDEEYAMVPRDEMLVSDDDENVEDD